MNISADHAGIQGLYYITNYTKHIPEIPQLKHIGGPKSRRVAHFGYEYSYTTGKLTPAPEIPEYLHDVARGCDLTRDIEFNQLIINEYKRGQNIAPHVDSNVFGPVIACVSSADTTVTFERGAERVPVVVSAGSMYVMTGEARYQWKHGIKHTGDTRYSLTYRTV